MKIGGKYFKCKAPKNSFERTRGVRSRICIFSKKDKEIINEIIRKKKDKQLIPIKLIFEVGLNLVS